MQIDWQRLFLSADGRIGRQEYWIAFLMMLGVSVVLRFIPILGGLATLALIYPQVCVGSKRLHDFGKSGFLMVLPYGIGLVATILAVIVGGMAILGSMAGRSAGAAAAVGAGLGAGLIFLLALLVCLGFVIWVGVMPSDPGENRYGPAPEVVPPTPVTPA